MNKSEIGKLIAEVRKFKNGWMSAAVLEEKLTEFERNIVESRGQPSNVDLYDAYLLGCEDECIPEPLTKDAFIAKFHAGISEEQP